MNGRRATSWTNAFSGCCCPSESTRALCWQLLTSTSPRGTLQPPAFTPGPITLCMAESGSGPGSHLKLYGLILKASDGLKIHATTVPSPTAELPSSLLSRLVLHSTHCVLYRSPLLHRLRISVHATDPTKDNGATCPSEGLEGQALNTRIRR